jgi:general secretion pathway protein E
LKVIVAQRLVRRNCTFCRTLQALTPAQARYFQMDPSLKLPQPQGCVYCGFRTFQGRIGLFEILFLDALWAQHLSEGASEASLQKLMQQYRFPSFYDDGREKILQGEMSGAALMATLSGDLFTVFAQENRK